mmetsp:Transcript_265/g.816  ORF Transcript_265/g.816 Transcript_265/m.816 type:complete len:204 (-) Transcript_265:108-719(-)
MASATSVVLTQLDVGVTDADGEILTAPFLGVCRAMLPVFDNLGTAFYVAKADVSGNIERLASRAVVDQARYERLFEIVRVEVAEGSTGRNDSCAKGLLWLKRFLEFTVDLLQRVAADDEATLSTAASEAYKARLAPFHGFLSKSAFTVVMNVVPSRATFVESLGADEASVKAELSAVSDRFGPLLAKVHAFLEAEGLNDPTPV